MPILNFRVVQIKETETKSIFRAKRNFYIIKVSTKCKAVLILLVHQIASKYITHTYILQMYVFDKSSNICLLVDGLIKNYLQGAAEEDPSAVKALKNLKSIPQEIEKENILSSSLPREL